MCKPQVILGLGWINLRMCPGKSHFTYSEYNNICSKEPIWHSEDSSSLHWASRHSHGRKCLSATNEGQRQFYPDEASQSMGNLQVRLLQFAIEDPLFESCPKTAICNQVQAVPWLTTVTGTSNSITKWHSHKAWYPVTGSTENESCGNSRYHH